MPYVAVTKQKLLRNKQMLTLCVVEYVELIAPSTPIKIGTLGKHRSGLSGTRGNAITTKRGQLALKDGDHSTPSLFHWPMCLVQRL